MERVLLAAAAFQDTATIDRGAAAGIIVIAIFLILTTMLVVIALFVFWLWMLIDAAGRDEAEYVKIGNGKKAFWILALVLSMIFGMSFVVSVLYYFLIRCKAVRPISKTPNKKK